MQYTGQYQLLDNERHNFAVERQDPRKPRRQATDKILYWLGTSAVHVLAQRFLNMDVVAAGPMPAGPKIFAANHPTTLDPFLLLTLAPEEMSILVTGGAFSVPLFGRYLRRIGHIPVVRGRGRESFAEAGRLLESGRSVGIFPEGALSPAIGDFQRPHTGVARLALVSGAAVIPVGIHPPEKRIWHIPAKIDGERAVGRFFAGGDYAVTIGRPLQFSGDIEDWDRVRAVSAQIMLRISQLSRQSATRVGPNPAPALAGGSSPYPTLETALRIPRAGHPWPVSR